MEVLEIANGNEAEQCTVEGQEPCSCPPLQDGLSLCYSLHNVGYRCFEDSFRCLTQQWLAMQICLLSFSVRECTQFLLLL